MGKLSISVTAGQHEPVGTSRLVIAGRPSMALRFETQGLILYAEASPLPGFGSDDIRVAEKELRKLSAPKLEKAAAQVAAAFDPNRPGLLCGPQDPAAVVRREIGVLTSPSARYAAETLILGAAAGSCGVPLFRLLTAECVAQELPTSAVIDPCSPGAQSRLENDLATGVRTFKVKCGRDRKRELEVIHNLTHTCEGVRVRLDPNQAWTVTQAKKFVRECPPRVLEWIEDPTPQPEEWHNIRSATGVAIAIDEPLCLAPSKEQILSINPDVLVVKPMALGGAFECLQLAGLLKNDSFFKNEGRRVSVSHLFDGCAAMSATIHLAFAVQSHGVTPGLGHHVALTRGDHVALKSADDKAPFPPELAGSRLMCPR